LSEIDADFAVTATDSSFVYEGSQSSTFNNNDWIPGTSQPAVVSDEPRYVPELNEGDGVRHQIFGLGTVMELDGDNAVIYFKGKGSRKLNIAFAPLEKL
jgi:hypothetical protein